MKRTSLIVFLAATLVSFYVSGPVNAYVSSVNFVGAFYRGSDTFYAASVVAYKAGANVTLAVNVVNDYYNYSLSPPYSPVNISAVIVGFDWGRNYTSTEASESNPVQMQPWQSRVFTITLNLPTNVTNLVTHRYTIYVEHIDRLTGTLKRIVGTWTWTGSDFAVYSAEQADAQDLYQQLVNIGLVTPTYYYYYTPPIMDFPYLPIVSSEARMLWTKARTDASVGSTYYARGDFANAKARYQTAYNMANQSLAIEATKSTSLEDAFRNLISSTSQAMNTTAESSETFSDALMKMAESSATQAQAFLILSVGLSIGVIMVGLGALLYGLAKRKIAQTAASEK